MQVMVSHLRKMHTHRHTHTTHLHCCKLHSGVHRSLTRVLSATLQPMLAHQLTHIFHTGVKMQGELKIVFTWEAMCPLKTWERGFTGGAVVENLPDNAGDMGSGPGLGRSYMPQSN